MEERFKDLVEVVNSNADILLEHKKVINKNAEVLKTVKKRLNSNADFLKDCKLIVNHNADILNNSTSRIDVLEKRSRRTNKNLNDIRIGLVVFGFLAIREFDTLRKKIEDQKKEIDKLKEIDCEMKGE